MLTIMTAMALAAAAPAGASTQPMPMGAMHGMDMSKVDHSNMDHSKMSEAMATHGDCCCKQGADGKMECNMSGKDSSASDHQGHSR